MLSNSPQATYSQRQNSGRVMCTLNPNLLPREWAGFRVKVHVQLYNAESALTKPYLYMYQKGSEKAQGETLGDVYVLIGTNETVLIIHLVL